MSDSEWLRDDVLDRNPKFKKFHSDITSCLTRFEKAQDWADLIEKITRLQAVINDYPQFKIIPERVLLSRTLARCLNPNLVIGIHRKALETLELIFKRIGVEQLSKDLPLYSFGIFTLFPNAAIATKPEIMRLYETYFLPLGAASLETCLGGLMASVLPAVHKEESSEMYRRAVLFLNNLLTLMTKQDRSKVFFHTLWTCIWKSPSLRTPAFNYIKERLPRAKSSMERRPSDVTEDMIGGDAQLVSHAFQASLTDTCESTQRGGLDCLTTNFLIHEDGVFSSSDFVTLMSTCLVLLTHNQLSTLRRVFIWIYGGDEVNPEYFEKHSLSIITYALSDLLEGVGSRDRNQGFEILLTLLHRPKGESHFAQVIPPLVPKLISAVVALAPHTKVSRIFEVVPLQYFFTGIKSMLLDFQKNVHLVEHSQLQLLLSFLEHVNGDVSMYFSSDIELYCDTLRELSVFLKYLALECKSMDPMQFLQYAGKSIDMLCIVYGILRALLSKEKIANTTVTITADFQEYVEALLENCYQQELSTQYLKRGTDQKFGTCPQSIVSLPVCSHGTEEIKLLMTSLNMLVTLSQHTDLEATNLSSPGSDDIDPPSARVYTEDNIASAIPKWLLQLLGIIAQTECHLAVHASELFLDVAFPDAYAVLDCPLRNYLLFETVACRVIVQRLWGFLDVENAMFHAHIGKQLCRLFTQGGVGGATGPTSFFGRLLSNVICNDMSLNGSKGCARFAFLWNATKDAKVEDTNRVLGSALSLMLDNLRSDTPSLRLVGSSWLSTAVTHLHRIMDSLLELIPDVTSSIGIDRKRTEYVVNVLLTMVEAAPHQIVNAMFEMKPTPVAIDVLSALTPKGGVGGYYDGAPILPASVHGQSYFAIVVMVLYHLSHFDMDIPNGQESYLASRCVNLLRSLLSAASTSSKRFYGPLAQVCIGLFDPVLSLLSHSVSRRFPVLQAEYLRLLQSILSHLEVCSALKMNCMAIDSESGDLIHAAVANPKFIVVLVEGITTAAALESVLELSCYNFLSCWRNAATSILSYTHLNVTSISRDLVMTYVSLMEEQRKRWIDTAFVPIMENCCKGIRQVVEYLFSEATSQQLEYREQTVVTNAVVPLLMSATTRVVTTPLQTAQNVWLTELQPKVLRVVLDWYGVVCKSVATYKKGSKAHKAEEVHMIAFQTTKGVVESSLRSLFDMCLSLNPSKFIAAILAIWSARRSFGIELFGEDDQDRNVIEVLNTLQGMGPDLVIDNVVTVMAQWRSERKLMKKKLTPAENLQEITPLHFLFTFVEHCKPADRMLHCFDTLLTAMNDGANVTQYHAYTLLMMIRVTELAQWRAGVMKGGTGDDRRIKRIATDLFSSVVMNVCRETVPLSLQDVSSGERTEDGYATTLVILDDVVLRCADTGFFFREPERICLLMSNVMQVPLNSVLKMKSEQDNVVQTIMMRIRNMGRIRAACNLLCTFLTKLPQVVIKRVGKDVFEYLQDSNFFKLDRVTLLKWRDILAATITSDAALMETLIASIRAPETGFLLTAGQKKSDALARARMLKRLGFVLFCTTLKDGAILNMILQKLTESIKYYQVVLDGTVLRYALFVFRVLMTRAPRSTLTAFWPIVISELIRIFASLDGKGRDKELVLEALKVVDFAMVCVPEEFVVFKWIFFDEASPGGAGPKPTPMYTPLIPALARTLSAAVGNRDASPVMEMGYEEPLGAPSNAQRPAISFPERCYDSVADVGAFVAQLIRSNEHGETNCAADGSFDARYVEWLLVGEFIQKGMPVDEASVKVGDEIGSTMNLPGFALVFPDHPDLEVAGAFESPSRSRSRGPKSDVSTEIETTRSTDS